MARAVGISEASVRRIWRSHGLKPHRVENIKISRVRILLSRYRGRQYLTDR